MSINTLLDDDLIVLYNDLYDAIATYNGTSINVIYDSSYEVQGSKERVIRVRAADVVSLSNTDTITIDSILYSVISFQNSTDNREVIIGLEI